MILFTSLRALIIILFEKVNVGLVEQRVRNENECSLPRN